MNIKDRINSFIDYLGITIKAFEINCGMSNGYISSIRKGLGVEKLENVLLKYPQLNRDWLLYGEGEMLKSNIQPESSTNADLSIERLLSIIESQQRTIEILTQKL